MGLRFNCFSTLKVLEAADVCGHWNGIKLSKLNPPRTFQQVKELDNNNENASK